MAPPHPSRAALLAFVAALACAAPLRAAGLAGDFVPNEVQPLDLGAPPGMVAVQASGVLYPFRGSTNENDPQEMELRASYLMQLPETALTRARAGEAPLPNPFDPDHIPENTSLFLPLAELAREAAAAHYPGAEAALQDAAGLALGIVRDAGGVRVLPGPAKEILSRVIGAQAELEGAARLDLRNPEQRQAYRGLVLPPWGLGSAAPGLGSAPRTGPSAAGSVAAQGDSGAQSYDFSFVNNKSYNPAPLGAAQAPPTPSSSRSSGSGCKCDFWHPGCCHWGAALEALGDGLSVIGQEMGHAEGIHKWGADYTKAHPRDLSAGLIVGFVDGIGDMVGLGMQALGWAIRPSHKWGPNNPAEVQAQNAKADQWDQQANDATHGAYWWAKGAGYIGSMLIPPTAGIGMIKSIPRLITSIPKMLELGRGLVTSAPKLAEVFKGLWTKTPELLDLKSARMAKGDAEALLPERALKTPQNLAELRQSFLAARPLDEAMLDEAEIVGKLDKAGLRDLLRNAGRWKQAYQTCSRNTLGYVLSAKKGMVISGRSVEKDFISMVLKDLSDPRNALYGKFLDRLKLLSAHEQQLVEQIKNDPQFAATLADHPEAMDIFLRLDHFYVEHPLLSELRMTRQQIEAIINDEGMMLDDTRMLEKLGIRLRALDKAHDFTPKLYLEWMNGERSIDEVMHMSAFIRNNIRQVILEGHEPVAASIEVDFGKGAAGLHAVANVPVILQWQGREFFVVLDPAEDIGHMIKVIPSENYFPLEAFIYN